MKKTIFSGLTVLRPDESVQSDNGAFIGRDRIEIDRGLRIGIKLHRHDGRNGLLDPVLAPSATALASGGSIPGGLAVTLGYTLVDAQGGETLISPTTTVATPSPLASPIVAPSGAFETAGGSLEADTYTYAITYADGEGGETPVGPSTTITRPPGFANGQIRLSGLDAGLEEAGAAGWRLYRARGGGEYVLLASGSLGESEYLDDGSVSPDCDVHPPTDGVNTTGQVNRLRVDLPADPTIEEATFINLYVSLGGEFGEESLLAQYPVASAGAAAFFDELEPIEGQPPDVNRSYGGAPQIDPDTELLDWHWKRPVAASASLPSGELGDVRLATDSGELWGVLSASAAVPSDWSLIGGGGSATPGPPGEKGSPGIDAGVHYRYSSNTEATDPGVGLLKFAFANTNLRISKTDADGADVAAWIATFDDSSSAVKGVLVLRSVDDPANFRVYSCAGSAFDLGTYRTMAVEQLASNGEFAADELLAVNFIRTGDKGEQGAPGEGGSGGSALTASGSLATVTDVEKLTFVGSGWLDVQVSQASAGHAKVQVIPSSSIDLVEAEKVAATPENWLRWLRAGDPTKPREEIWGANRAPANPNDFAELYVWSNRLQQADNGYLFLRASAPTIGQGGLDILMAKSGLSLVRLKWPGAGEFDELTIIDSLQRSNFLQLDAPRQETDYGLVESLPSSPVEGDRCKYIADASEGVIWDLIYDGVGEYPWVCIGGLPLSHYVMGSGERKDAAYGDCTSGVTTVPEVFAPLKGIYEIAHGVGSMQLMGSPASNSRVSIEVGGEAASDDDSFMSVSIQQFEASPGSIDGIRKTLGAGENVKQKYRGFTNTLSWAYSNRWVKLMPVRVG